MLPLVAETAPGNAIVGPADINITLSTTYSDTPNGGTGMFEINGASFKGPAMLMLLQVMSGARKAEDLLP